MFSIINSKDLLVKLIDKFIVTIEPHTLQPKFCLMQNNTDCRHTIYKILFLSLTTYLLQTVLRKQKIKNEIT